LHTLAVDGLTHVELPGVQMTSMQTPPSQACPPGQGTGSFHAVPESLQVRMRPPGAQIVLPGSQTWVRQRPSLHPWPSGHTVEGPHSVPVALHCRQARGLTGSHSLLMGSQMCSMHSPPLQEVPSPHSSTS
jgi:hypothetical protein